MALRVDEPAPLVIPTERARTPEREGTPLLLLAVVAALLVGTGLAVAAEGDLVARQAVGAAVIAAWIFAGATLAVRPPLRPLAAWVLSGSTVAGAAYLACAAVAADWSGTGDAVAQVVRPHAIGVLPSFGLAILLALPAGRLDSRARKVGTLVGFGVGLALGAFLWTIRPDLPGWLLWLVSVLMLLCGLPGAHRSYLQTAGLERQRLQWVGCATAVAFEGTLVVVALRLFAGWPSNSAVVAAALTILIPLGLAAGTSHRLVARVDRILVHTVSLAGLTGVVVAVYLVIVLGLGRVPDDAERHVLILSMAAAAVAALLYLPARERLSEFANRLVYGERQAPDEVLRTFGGRLSRAIPMDELLLQLAESLKKTMALTAAEVWTGTGGVVERTVSVPDRPKRRIELGEKEQPVVARAGVSGNAWASVWLPALLDGRDDVAIRIAPVSHSGELFGLIVAERPADGDVFGEEARERDFDCSDLGGSERCGSIPSEPVDPIVLDVDAHGAMVPSPKGAQVPETSSGGYRLFLRDGLAWPRSRPSGSAAPLVARVPTQSGARAISRHKGGTMAVDRRLHERRINAVRAWTAFVEHGDLAAASVRPEILHSWSRSSGHLSPHVGEAPLADQTDTESLWRGSPLQIAVQRVESELRRTAEDGDLVIAITDPETRILWTYGGRVMRRKAESVNFVAGGRWDERSVGVNALNLALQTDQPAMVFSAEHYAPIVHDWVCWAAPVHDPTTGQQLGVIDLSTTWERTHPIGLATARVMARLIETALPVSAHPAVPAPTRDEPSGGLRLTLLGRAEAQLDGRRLLLNRRQTEIVALLALNQHGLSLEQLHALLYGDHAVTLSTLKAEVSHLRSAVQGALASRPYRLTLPVATDVQDVLDRLRAGDIRGAVAAYGGDLLPGTNSPALCELADYVAVAVREALLGSPDPEAVLRYSEIASYDTEVVEACLAAIGPHPHPAKPLLKGRLAAQRD